MSPEADVPFLTKGIACLMIVMLAGGVQNLNLHGQQGLETQNSIRVLVLPLTTPYIRNSPRLGSLLSSLGQSYDIYTPVSKKVSLSTLERYSIVIDSNSWSDAFDDWSAIKTYVNGGGWFVKESECAVPESQSTLFGLKFDNSCDQTKPELHRLEFLLSPAMYPYPSLWNLTRSSFTLPMQWSESTGAAVLVSARDVRTNESTVAFSYLPVNSGRIYYIGFNAQGSPNEVFARFDGLGPYIYSYIIDELYKWKTGTPLRAAWVGVGKPLQIGLMMDDFTAGTYEQNYVECAMNFSKQYAAKLSFATIGHEFNSDIGNQFSNEVLSHPELVELINHLWFHKERYSSLAEIEQNFQLSQTFFVQNSPLLGSSADGWKYVVLPYEVDNNTIGAIAQNYGVAAIIGYPFIWFHVLDSLHAKATTGYNWTVPYNASAGWFPYGHLPGIGVLQVPRFTYPYSQSPPSLADYPPHFQDNLTAYVREMVLLNMPLLFGTHPQDWHSRSPVVISLERILDELRNSGVGVDLEFVSQIVKAHVLTYQTCGIQSPVSGSVSCVHAGWTYVETTCLASTIVSSGFVMGTIQAMVESSPAPRALCEFPLVRVVSPYRTAEVAGANWSYDSSRNTTMVTANESNMAIGIQLGVAESAGTSTAASNWVEYVALVLVLGVVLLVLIWLRQKHPHREESAPSVGRSTRESDIRRPARVFFFGMTWMRGRGTHDRESQD
jgi:hypothetical protein